MTGTSVSDSTATSSTTGLVATSHPAITPPKADPSRRPSPYTAMTASPRESGTTANIAHWPPKSFAAAISMGSPDEYVGTIADCPSSGRYPSGANVHARFGHGTCSTHG